MSGRAPSRSPKKERSSLHRSGPSERRDRKPRIKEEPDEDVFVKAEPEEEKPRLVKAETGDEEDMKLVLHATDVATDPDRELTWKERRNARARERAVKYLKQLGLPLDSPYYGHNFIREDGAICNPTQEVQRYTYYDNHEEQEGIFNCKDPDPDDPYGPAEHYCQFLRDGYLNHGYRYLNRDGSVFYENPDGSQYYFYYQQRWFKPPPTL